MNIRLGQQKVSVASTSMNDRSSRSHTILILNYAYTRNDNNKIIKARLNLVDLAGSERISTIANAADKKLETESKNINKSLLFLKQVIAELKDNKKPSFRNSKLTLLLRESLGGNSKTSVICTISNEIQDLQMSIQTLEFAK